MEKKLFAFFMPVLVLLSYLFVWPYAAGAEDGSYPNGPTCSSLPSARWQDSSLYDLTYGCMPAGWEAFFKLDAVRSRVKFISDAVKSQAKEDNTIEPAIGNTFRALYLVAPNNIKAVIMSRNPAVQPGLTTGLAFSTEPGVDPSSRFPSTRRILQEAQNEGKCVDPKNGDLKKWADEGVVLLYTALSIPCSKTSASCSPAGHVPLWEEFTRLLMTHIDATAKPSAFIFWGGPSEEYGKLITNGRHKALKGGHPTPAGASEDFFCKNYFNCANAWLTEKGRSPVNWDLTGSCDRLTTACIWARRTVPQCVRTCALSPCN